MKFTSPYPSGDDGIKITAVIPLSAYSEVRRLRLQKGTTQVVIAHLWQKLINLCKKHGINQFTQAREFERLVIESELSLPPSPSRIETDGGTPPLANPPTSNQDVRRRTQGKNR